jgi:hypothetical protein
MNAKSTEVMEPRRRAPSSNPMQMLAVAVERGDDMEKLRQLMDLKDRWEATEAKKSFVVAMSAFKAEPMEILKTKYVDIPGGAKFRHATLADVADGACAAMAKHGLSHRWETKQEGELITVTCVLTHIDGHEERTTLFARPDDSGKKNAIQAVASTVTYLERYTLMAACGLAAKDMDDDGRGAGKQKQTEPAPEGYAGLKADMQIKAEEGLEALMAAWQGTKRDFRVYVVKEDDAWWKDLKAKAEKVKVP